MAEACCGGACDAKPTPTGSDRSAPDAHDGHNHGPMSRGMAWQVAISGGLIGAGMLLSWAGLRPAAIVAYLVAVGISGYEPARRAWRSLLARRLDINVLMSVAVAGALALGDWSEAAAVVWLFGVAQWLEGLSTERARHAIRSLMSLAPSIALVRRHGADVQVPVADVVVGDVVVVRPGERVPVDGMIVSGESAVDQASVTGESFPADKIPGDPIFAGTINGTGALEIEASRPASDSTLARIIHMVESAQSRRAPMQTFVERFALLYTPAVVILAALVAFVPPLFAGGLDGYTAALAIWGYRALALLVVACPCALVISTPVSIVSALTAAAREGVLIKGGAHLERLGMVRAIAFDKTGTLTLGKVTVTDVLAVDGASTDGVLAVAASLEMRSEHPIGRAIVTSARTAGVTIEPGEGFRALPGLGAEAMVAAAPAIVGSHRLFEERQLCTPSLHARIDEVHGRGGTPVLVGHDGAALGVISLTDEMRDEGRRAVARLRQEGIEWVVLLTGDAERNARIVQEGLGLDEMHAGLMPDDKVREVARLRDRYGVVAMVGDGVNDAPALAAADVGIAMGAAGSDVAIETADVALMSDDLSKLPYALRLGRATLANIRTNVAIALGLKIAFIVLAASGLATLWMAVLADTGASLIVTANSLRLLRGVRT
jgi:Cd2+/Zn2+-exporting ATPase